MTNGVAFDELGAKAAAVAAALASVSGDAGPCSYCDEEARAVGSGGGKC